MARHRHPAAALALLLASTLPRLAPSYVLTSTPLAVELDDAFPRPVNYTHAGTGETIYAALTGWGFHPSLSVNGGQVTCGEAAMSTVYLPLPSPPGTAISSFVVTAGCVVNWGVGTPGTPALPTLVTLTLNGTVGASPDAQVPGAGVFTWALTGAAFDGGAPAGLAVTTLDLVGFELLSFRPAPLTPACMYSPTDNGAVPACGGDTYYVDSWSNVAIDEWYSETWAATVVTGAVDVNSPAGFYPSCVAPQLSRHAAGPFASVVAGGWSHSGRTGAAVVSSQKHAPFWTGPRAYDLPGRCSVFTVAPATLHARYLCGDGLPVTFAVGLFPDVTSDGAVTSDDVHRWRRAQFPRADLLYRTTLPYKLQVDLTSYNTGWTRIPFVDVLAYAANISAITDGYPQTPILVGWQGLGHDTLYPSWDTVNIHPDVGGAAGLEALATGLQAATRSNRSSLSYHVNSDEAYSLFDGTPNPGWDARMCRVNADHATPWAMNCSATHFQTPDCGLRCSISKTKDAVSGGRYARYARFFDAVPAAPAMRTIHSDAWRDVGVSWEPEALGGFIDWANEQRCGQQGDAAFWGGRGMSMGVEGNDGQAAEFMGTVSFLYHAGPQDGWSAETWGRLVYGTTLGWDLDVYCNNPGGRCSWEDMADGFYLGARVYQLALTDELMGSAADATAGGAVVHRFGGGGRILAAHTGQHTVHTIARAGASRHRRAAPGDVPTPSTWPYGGDAIPILDAHGGALLPLVGADGATLDPGTLHAYQKSGGVAPPDPACPLFSSNSALFTGADNTALGNWDGAGALAPYAQYTMDPALPVPEAAAACNASCWANTSCAGWDVIKATPSSGHVKPLCSLYTAAQGCFVDPNQFAGVKMPLPPPPPPSVGGVTQTWTLPLSWVGSTVSAVSLTPGGVVAGQPAVLVNGRNLTLVGVMPGWPVRLTRS